MATCFWCGREHVADHLLSVCAECLTRMSTMRLLEMSGPHPLDSAVIDELLTRTSSGNSLSATSMGMYSASSASDVRIVT